MQMNGLEGLKLARKKSLAVCVACMAITKRLMAHDVLYTFVTAGLGHDVRDVRKGRCQLGPNHQRESRDETKDDRVLG